MAEVENIDKADEHYNGSLCTNVRQVFVCCHKSCLPGFELEEGLLPQSFAKSFKDHKADFDVVKADFDIETELYVCEEGGADTDGDVLIFPEMVRYKAVKETEVNAFVEDLVLNGEKWTYGTQEELRGSFVFVCGHDKDALAFLDKFEEEIVSRGVSDQIFVRLCCGLGGHKFRGNLIVYCPDTDLSGDWSLNPEDVPELLDQLIAKRDQVIQAEKVEEEEGKVPSGNGLVLEKESLKKHGGGCCQGSNGISCCQENQTLFKEEEGFMKDPEPIKKEERFMKDKEEGSMKDKEEGSMKDKEEGFMKLKWFRSMEKQKLLLSAKVVGAVTTIAVAFYFYRRSG